MPPDPGLRLQSRTAGSSCRLRRWPRRSLALFPAPGAGRSFDAPGLDAENRRQECWQRVEPFATVATSIQLSIGGAEIHPQRIEIVGIQPVAQNSDVAIALRQAIGERDPVGPGVFGAIDPQLSVH